MGAGIEGDLGDDPGETAALLAIDFGTNGTVVSPAAPGDGIVWRTISPTPVPTAVPLTPAPIVSVFGPRRRYSDRGGGGGDRKVHGRSVRLGVWVDAISLPSIYLFSRKVVSFGDGFLL